MWWLSFRTSDVGGPVADPPTVFEDGRLAVGGVSELAAAIARAQGEGREIAFAIHGFNNTFDVGVASLSGFVEGVRVQVPALASSLFVGVLWPGDAHVGFLSYPTEEADADRTSDAFAGVIRRIAFTAPPHFVAHSLGCRVALQTLTTLAKTTPSRTWADQVVLFAGAVDNDVLGRPVRYRRAAANARRIVTVASTADLVLRFAFPAGDWLAGIFGGGYTKTALGRSGPSSDGAVPSTVAPFQVGSLGVGHGDYLGGNSPLRVRASAFAGHALERDTSLRY